MVLGNKILITGANGFLGSHLSLFLANKGYEVVSLVRDIKKSVHLNIQNIKLIQTNYHTDLKDEFFDNVTTVIHAAALLSSNFGSKKNDFYEVNVNLTKIILKKIAKKNIKRFIYISSVGIYGDTEGVCASENNGIGKKLTPYELSKWEGERVCETFNSQVPIIILRLSQLYGSGMKYGWQEVFNEISKGKFFLIGKAEGTIQPLYLGDAVEGIASVIGGKGQGGEIYNLAGPRPVSLNELFSTMADILNVSSIHRLPYWPIYFFSCFLEFIPYWIKTKKMNLLNPHNVSFFRKKNCYDIDKARKNLGFNPLTDIKDGLKETIKEWQSNKNYE